MQRTAIARVLANDRHSIDDPSALGNRARADGSVAGASTRRGRVVRHGIEDRFSSPRVVVWRRHGAKGDVAIDLLSRC
jgi:hypothetical protein